MRHFSRQACLSWDFEIPRSGIMGVRLKNQFHNWFFNRQFELDFIITYEIKKYYWGKLWIQLAIYAGRYERRGIKEIYPFTLPGKQAILIKAA